jgi:hypothetical protein
MSVVAGTNHQCWGKDWETYHVMVKCSHSHYAHYRSQLTSLLSSENTRDDDRNFVVFEGVSPFLPTAKTKNEASEASIQRHGKIRRTTLWHQAVTAVSSLFIVLPPTTT